MFRGYFRDDNRLEKCIIRTVQNSSIILMLKLCKVWKDSNCKGYYPRYFQIHKLTDEPLIDVSR